jgi:pimeloyl-ACP methyl ester carboxylesterase
VAIDSRGHGASEVPQERDAYQWRYLGEDVLAVVDALGLGENLLGVGHSAGGAHLALAELERPGTFRRVVLLDAIIGPPAFFESPVLDALVQQALKRQQSFENRDTARARFASKSPMNAWAPEALDAYVEFGLTDTEDGQVTLNCPPGIEAWLYGLGAETELYGRLQELNFQALLLTGNEKMLRPVIQAQHEGMAHSILKVLPELGHFMPQENPGMVAESILAWFADLSRDQAVKLHRK